MGSKVGALIAACLMLGTVDTAQATQAPNDFYEFRVLFDIDSNAASGCDIAAHDANFAGPVSGIEYVLTAFVERFASGAVVDFVFLQKCVAGSLAPLEEIDPGNWNAGLENGIGGADIVEFYVPRNAIGSPTATTLGFHARQAMAMFNDVLLTTDGQNDGEAIVLRLREGESVPALSSLALLCVIALLALVAVRRLRRHPSTAAAAVTVALLASVVATAWAVTISLDGNVSDWAGIPPVGTDVTGDSSIGDPAEDIVAAFATFDAQNIYFRMDLVNLAPTVCGNGVLEPGEQCEMADDCAIEFETAQDQGGGGGDPCMCVSCTCQGDCSPP